MRILIRIRLKSMFSNLKKAFSGKRKGVAAIVLPALVLCLLSFEGLMFGAWKVLSVYLETDFAWLYFALAGLFAFALGIIGTVFTTQNQLYQAKDNELLLAMPLKPSAIIGSRVLVLYLLTFLFAAAVMLPAGLVYFISSGFSAETALLLFFIIVLVSMLTQALTCLLGWLLHFLLAGFRHKAIVATVFMTAVMIVYFLAINQIENIMLLLVENGGKIASAIQTFAWPFYALGNACLGNWGDFLMFAVCSVLIFGVVTLVLNVTFVKAMLVSSKTKRSVSKKRDGKVRSAEGAICRKESKHFFYSTTYLVNIGMGLFMVAAFVGAGILLKDKISVELTKMFSGKERSILPIIFSGAMGLLSAMTPISAPSVSLEGKHIWILRSMPVSGAQVLRAKLRFHCIATLPLAAVGTLLLGFVYGCGIMEVLLAAVNAAQLFFLCGSLGLVLNMCFPRLDWPNEAVPCKQSMSVFLVIFIMFFFSAAYAGLCFAGNELLGPGNSALVLLFVTVILAAVNCLFYLLMMKWGGKKFETL